MASKRRDVAWGFFCNGALYSYEKRETAVEYRNYLSTAHDPGSVFCIREPRPAARSIESLRVRILKASLDAAHEQGRLIQRELDALRKDITPPKPKPKRGRANA